jgi:hypothetical protein
MSRDRLLELLADRATQGLSDQESRELDALLAQHPDVDADVMDRAAAAVDLAFAADTAPMPEAVRKRVAAQIPREFPGQDVAPAPIALIGKPGNPGKPRSVYLGWLAAAACLALAAIAWWPRARQTTPAASDRQVLLSKPGTLQGAWGEWSDGSVQAEVKGVTGDVIWNEAEQRGYMRFTGLPVADPAKQVYQLWIIDDRGMDQRISGAIFDAQGTGEVLVPITPQIKTRNAAAFAVTIEEPGGTWVSDMKRRVVIAKPKRG